MRRTERRKTMKNENTRDRVSVMARLMIGLGVLGAALIVLLRIGIVSFSVAGLSADGVAIGVLVAVLVALGALVFVLRSGPRCEIVGKPAVTLSAVTLVVGAALVLHGAVEALARLGALSFYSVESMAVSESATVINVVLPWLQTVFSVVGGVALVLTGLRIASEGSTRRGIAQILPLLPVLWVWFALANHMMSYASLVRITDGFFTLAMYVFEMLFLFRFAGYLAGIGKSSVGSMLFFSATTVVCTLSAPLVRYLSVTGEEGGTVAGPLDLAVGVLALAVCITLYQSLSAPVPAEESIEDSVEWVGETDEDADSLLIDEIGETDEE